MKRFIVFLVILAMAGCACPRADTNGVITKSTLNCFKAAQEIVCNASPDVLAAADLVLTLLKGVADAYIPGTAEFAALVTAQNIQSVGCSTLTGLNGLISYLQSIQGKSMMTAVGPKKAPSPQPFIDWRDKK